MARITRLFLIVAIVLVLLMRLSLAVTRYFDPDEFAHLHWSYLLLTGNVPYRDFFFIIIPAYQIFLLPIFLFGQSAATPVIARFWQLALYIFTTILVYRVSLSFFKKQTGALLSLFIFITFPMTIDKTIDIRPDMLMVAMILLAMLATNSFLIGLFVGISLVIHPKIIFAVPMIIFLFATSSRKPHIAPAVIGFVVPVLLFFLYLAYQQVLPAAFTSILQNSVIANTGKGHFSPLLALSPFPLVYLTQGGISLPWIINSAYWILAAIGLIFLWIKQRRLGIGVALYFAFGIGLLFVFPVPFLQYFLPLTVMVSIIVGNVIGKNKTIITIIIVITIIFSFFLQYRERVTQDASNAEQLQVLRDVLAVSRPDETFYDMVGSYIYRPDGYYICCHPYGEFAKKLVNPSPSLRESLVSRQTKFLILDRVGLVFWQTPEPDLTFLRTNYLPMKYNKLYSLGIQFRCQNGACVQYTMNNQPASNMSANTFTINVPETYMITLKPNNETATVDGKEVRNGQTLFLSAESHHFAAPSVIMFRIQLTR